MKYILFLRHLENLISILKSFFLSIIISPSSNNTFHYNMLFIPSNYKAKDHPKGDGWLSLMLYLFKILMCRFYEDHALPLLEAYKCLCFRHVKHCEAFIKLPSKVSY